MSEIYSSQNQESFKIKRIVKKPLIRSDEELTKKDLEHIYKPEEMFTTSNCSPKIESHLKTIKKHRNIKNDLSVLFNCKPNEISTNSNEAMNGNIKFHYGNIIFDGYINPSEKIFPKNVYGSLYFNDVLRFFGITMPDTVYGNIYALEAFQIKDTVFPKNIYGDLSIGIFAINKEEFDNVTMPKKITGGLTLHRLSSIKEPFTLPEEVGNFNMKSIRFAEAKLTTPRIVNGDFYMTHLESGKNVVFPEKVSGDVYLDGIRYLNKLVLPKEVGGKIYLRQIYSMKGLENLPEEIKSKIVLGDINYKNYHKEDKRGIVETLVNKYIKKL